MITRRIRTLVLGMGALLLLAACGGGGNTQTAASAIEDYLRTRITGDESRLVALTCREREADARAEAASFAAMQAEIQDGMSCKENGADGAFTVVACQGTMVTSYAGETRNWDLADRAFRALQEDGTWKVCGYAR
ncbi:MAG: hypothetical protein IT323_06395 [Anaerolineae bacterium]|nr:hypothetical protein [Anaerolineae bacterium]